MLLHRWVIDEELVEVLPLLLNNGKLAGRRRFRSHAKIDLHNIVIVMDILLVDFTLNKNVTNFFSAPGINAICFLPTWRRLFLIQYLFCLISNCFI
jgi:hypothetical protein